MGRDINTEFKKAIEKKRLIKFIGAKRLVNKEIRAAKDDLTEAEDRFKNNKYKYASITSYYSMFHTGRTLLYLKGYREKSHYYLLVGLRYLYTDKGLIDEKIIDDFYDAMVLREEADYYSRFSIEGAEQSIISAKKIY